MIKKVFRIPDMECSNCVMHLEGIEDELPGIRHIKGSYVQQKLDVEYDETKVTEQQIIAAIVELGYHVKETA